MINLVPLRVAYIPPPEAVAILLLILPSIKLKMLPLISDTPAPLPPPVLPVMSPPLIVKTEPTLVMYTPPPLFAVFGEATLPMLPPLIVKVDPQTCTPPPKNKALLPVIVPLFKVKCALLLRKTPPPPKFSAFAALFCIVPPSIWKRVPLPSTKTPPPEAVAILFCIVPEVKLNELPSKRYTPAPFSLASLYEIVPELIVKRASLPFTKRPPPKRAVLGKSSLPMLPPVMVKVVEPSPP